VTARAQRGKPWCLLRSAAVLTQDIGGDAIGENLPREPAPYSAVHVFRDVERELEQIAVPERIAQFAVTKRRRRRRRREIGVGNGTSLSIQQNTALFSLLGTVHGGNG
jgi:hypothetical protein